MNVAETALRYGDVVREISVSGGWNCTSQGSRSSERKANGNMSREEARNEIRTSDFRRRTSADVSGGRCVRRPRGRRVAASGSPASDVRSPLSATARGLSPLNSETGGNSMAAEINGDD